MGLKNNSGYTLTEIMVSISIFVFICAGLSTILMVGNTSWKTQLANASAQQQIRNSIEMLERDFRSASGIIVNQDSENMNVSFTKPSEGNVTYSWTKAIGGDNLNQLIRTSGVKTRIIARDISSLTLTDSASDIKIDITANVQEAKGPAVDFRMVSNLAKR